MCSSHRWQKQGAPGAHAPLPFQSHAYQYGVESKLHAHECVVPLPSHSSTNASYLTRIYMCLIYKNYQKDPCGQCLKYYGGYHYTHLGGNTQKLENNKSQTEQ